MQRRHKRSGVSVFLDTEAQVSEDEEEEEEEEGFGGGTFYVLLFVILTKISLKMTLSRRLMK